MMAKVMTVDTPPQSAQHDVKLDALRAKIKAGDESGSPTPWSMDRFKQQMREKHGQKG